MKKNLLVENARLRFRNFSGAEGRYNNKGNRNFCVELDPDTADNLMRDGWNVKQLIPREDGDQPMFYLQVAVRFDNIPPKIVMITSNGKTILKEDQVDMLDWAEIENVDLTIQPYDWKVGDKYGRKAYLKAMYVTLVEDELDRKYADVPDSAQNTLGAKYCDEDD